MNGYKMAMDKENYKNYNIFREPRSNTIIALNNIYVTNLLINNALLDVRKEIKTNKELKLGFEVPSIKQENIVFEKSIPKLITLLNTTINSELHKQSLVSAVAVTENYLLSSLRLIFTMYPQKLTLNIEGIPAEKKIDLDIILEAKDLDLLLANIIENKLIKIFYESPQRYFQFIEAVLTITIPEEMKDEFIEVKATRDIIVHNAGITNSVYINKVSENARAVEGQILPVDSRYFESSIRCMKKLTHFVFEELLDKFGNV